MAAPNHKKAMTKFRMTKLEEMTNGQILNGYDFIFSWFGLRASFDIRHSCFDTCRHSS